MNVILAEFLTQPMNYFIKTIPRSMVFRSLFQMQNYSIVMMMFRNTCLIFNEMFMTKIKEK